MVDELLPNVLIAGVTKAGTTSLFWYLAQHPDICAATKKEINYFSPLRYGDRPEHDLDYYAQHFAHWSGERYRLEASPLYFYGGAELTGAVGRVLSKPKVIISLRDPVDRLWSAYRYKVLQGALGPSVDFQAFFEHCLELRKSGADVLPENDVYRALSIGRYIDSLHDWFDVHDDRVRIVFFDALATAPQAAVEELCRWLDIDSAIAHKLDYGVSQKTLKPRSRLLHQGARVVADSVDRLFGLNRHRKLKGALRGVYLRINASSRVEQFSPEDRRRVADLYAQSSQLLAEELSIRGYRNLPAWLR